MRMGYDSLKTVDQCAEDFLRSLDDLRRRGVVLLILDQVAGFLIEVDTGQRVASALGVGQDGGGRGTVEFALSGLGADARDQLAVGIVQGNTVAGRTGVHGLLGLQGSQRGAVTVIQRTRLAERYVDRSAVTWRTGHGH